MKDCQPVAGQPVKLKACLLFFQKAEQGASSRSPRV
jgi:hypothetical protein